jgi:hypothetical protein
MTFLYELDSLFLTRAFLTFVWFCWLLIRAIQAWGCRGAWDQCLLGYAQAHCCARLISFACTDGRLVWFRCVPAGS